jgi:hypothetical protein
MPTGSDFRALALALPGVEERDHMGAPSFRVAGKIFAQLADAQATGLVKMSLAEQDALRESDPDRFWVPPHWSKFGWTYVRLADTDIAQLRDLLERSWSLVAPKKLVAAPRTTTRAKN